MGKFDKEFAEFEKARDNGTLQFEDEFAQFEKERGLFDAQTQNDKNLENKPLIDIPGLRDISTPENLYEIAGDVTDIVGKIPATIATPITEVARMPFKYIAENVGKNTSQTPPIDAYAEMKQLGVSDRAGLGLLLKDISNAVGIKQEPIAQIKSQRFPKAAAFLEQLTDPSNAAALAMEGTMAAKLPGIPEAAGKAKVSLDTAMAYLKSVSKDSGLFEKLSKSGEIWNIAKMIQDNPQYMKYNPAKVYDVLHGATDKVIGKRQYNQGDIGKLNIERGNIIENSDFNTSNTASPLDIRESAKMALDQGNVIRNDIGPANRMIETEIPVEQFDPKVINQINSYDDAKLRSDTIDLQLAEERIRIKEELLAQARAKMNEATSMQESLFEPSAKKNKIEEARNIVMEMGDDLQNMDTRPSRFVDNSELLRLNGERIKLDDVLANKPRFQNAREYSDFVDRRNTMSLEDVVNLRKRGNVMYNPEPGQMRVEQAPMSLAGKAIVNSVDDFLLQALDQGQMNKYESLGRDMNKRMTYSDLISGNLRPNESSIPDPSRLVYDAGIVKTIAGNPWSRGVRPALSKGISGIQNMGQNMASTATNALRPAISASAMAQEVRPDKKAVAMFRIPRTSAGVIENMPMVRRKLEMMVGPDASELLDSVQSTEDLKNIMSNFARMYPEMFSGSKYGTFDGYVVNPESKKIIMSDVLKSQLTPAQKADKINTLTKEGFIGE